MCIRDRDRINWYRHASSLEFHDSAPNPGPAVMERGTMPMSKNKKIPVSYTHLDVYKRQARRWLWCAATCRTSRSPIRRIDVYKRQIPCRNARQFGGCSQELVFEGCGNVANCFEDWMQIVHDQCWSYIGGCLLYTSFSALHFGVRRVSSRYAFCLQRLTTQ